MKDIRRWHVTTKNGKHLEFDSNIQMLECIWGNRNIKKVMYR